MKCQFCQQICKQRNTSQWYMCEACKVFFNNSKRETVFRPNSEAYWYWLFIDFDANSTRVEALRNPKTLPQEELEADMPHPKVLLQLDHALQGVTPQNMHDKLKLLLVFS